MPAVKSRFRYRPSEGKNGERRRSQRVLAAGLAWICSPTATDDSTHIAVGPLNYSRHGVGFHSPVDLTVGNYFILESGSRREIKIATSRKVESGFEIGAEFC